MKVSVIPIAIGSLGPVLQGLITRQEDREIRGLVETTQTTTILWSARIPRRVVETWEDLLSLKHQEKYIS